MGGGVMPVEYRAWGERGGACGISSFGRQGCGCWDIGRWESGWCLWGIWHWESGRCLWVWGEQDGGYPALDDWDGICETGYWVTRLLPLECPALGDRGGVWGVSEVLMSYTTC